MTPDFGLPVLTTTPQTLDPQPNISSSIYATSRPGPSDNFEEDADAGAETKGNGEYFRLFDQG